MPRLCNGDRLTREEFERRWEAMPDLKLAELIEGRAYITNRVPFSHAGPHADIVGWLGMYHAYTPRTLGGNNGSVRMDSDNMPQPDGVLMIDSRSGGQARIDEDDYIDGAPELIVEVAFSSASYDLHDKLHVYRRNGVREYIVWRIFENEIDYFVLRGTQYVRHSGDTQGRYRSEIFPGLWLDSKPLLNGELATVFDYLRSGLSSSEHAEFVRRLESIGG
jgi:Uma2 family endonuclease